MEPDIFYYINPLAKNDDNENTLNDDESKISTSVIGEISSNNHLSTHGKLGSRLGEGFALKAMSPSVRNIVENMKLEADEVARENKVLRRNSITIQSQLELEQKQKEQMELEVKNLLRSNELNRFVILWTTLLIGILVISQALTSVLVVRSYATTTVDGNVSSQYLVSEIP